VDSISTPVGQSVRFARARQWLTGSIAIFALYTGSGWIGILLLRRLMDPTIVAVAPSVALPWLPVGFGVAGLLHYGRGAWPGIFLGSLALWGGIQGDPWQSVVPDAIGETLSIVAIVAMLRSWGFRLALDRYQDSLLLLGALAVGRLIAVGVDAINAPLMALLFQASGTDPALLQAFGVTQTGSTLVIHLDVFAFIGRWWANSVAGGVLVVPLLALLTADPAFRRRWAVGLPVLTAAVAAWIVIALGVSVDAWRPALLGVALSIVALAATSFGVGVASSTTLVLAMASATGYALRLGMFSGLSQTAQLEVAWGFLALLSGTGLFLTALLAQRERGRREIAASVERYRQLFTSNPFPVWAEDPMDGRIRLANPAALRTYGYDEAQFLALRGANLRSDDGAPRSLPGRAHHSLATVERHRTAGGDEIDVEVTRVPIDFGDGTLLTCFVEPLSERVELRIAALAAGDLERFRLGSDLLHRLNPILIHVGQRAEEFESRVSRGEPPDGALLASIAELVGAASGICRRLTRGASALQGADGDLTEAIRRLPSSFVDAEPEIQVSVQARAPISLSIERRDHIYRLAEDAVRAAVARAGARNVRVSLDVSPARVRLVVEDDGDPLDTPESAASLGLRSMSWRAMAASGQLQIGRAGAGGTAVAVECAQDTEVVGAARVPASSPGTVWTASAVAPVSRRADAPATRHPGAWAMLDAALLAAAYVVAGAIGLWLINHLPTAHPSFDPGLALPWLANGVGVVGLLLRGERLWPAVFIASVAVWRGIAADPWITVLCDAIGESIAAIVTVRLLRRWDFHLAFDRFRDVALLAAAAAAGRAVVFFADTAGINIAALITPLAVTPGMRTAYAPAATLFGISSSAIAAGGRWWLNGVAGVVLAVPALGSWSGRVWAKLRVRPAELTVWLTALAAAVLAILIAPQAGWRLSTLAVGLVIVTWSAARFGVTLASVATLLLSLAATTGFILQIGPLAPTGPGEGIGVLWGYIALLGATAQFVATTLAEHNQDVARLERNSRRYRALFDAVPHPVFAYEIVGGRIRLANRAATLRYGYAPADLSHLAVADLDCDARLPPAPRPDTIGPMLYMTRHRTRTGDAFDVELALTVLDVDGSPGALCFAIDVSERNRLRSRVLEATDRERRHLARDLHDGLGQVLTGLQLGVSALKRTIERGEPIAATSVAFVADAAREAQRTADRVLRGISPLQDTNGDLLQAIRNLADHLPPAYRSQLKVSVFASALVVLPLEQREHLYQIVREAVTNAMKHARAKEIAVTVFVTSSEIDARVEDDGVGFEPDARSSGIGLESLSLRAGVLRGQLAVAPRAGRGTVVRCRCPQPLSAA
jgi:PAS domain S-box-containing protein